MPQKTITYLGNVLTTKESILEAFKDGYRSHGTEQRASEGTECANCLRAPFALDLDITEDVKFLNRVLLELGAVDTDEFMHPRRINLCGYCVPLHTGAKLFVHLSDEYPTLAAALHAAEESWADMVGYPNAHATFNHKNNYGVAPAPTIELATSAGQCWHCNGPGEVGDGDGGSAAATAAAAADGGEAVAAAEVAPPPHRVRTWSTPQ